MTHAKVGSRVPFVRNGAAENSEELALGIVRLRIKEGIVQRTSRNLTSQQVGIEIRYSSGTSGNVGEKLVNCPQEWGKILPVP